MLNIEIGKKVQHAYTKEYLWILSVSEDKILCRTKDLREIWFYKHEIEDIDPLKESRGSKRFL